MYEEIWQNSGGKCVLRQIEMIGNPFLTEKRDDFMEIMDPEIVKTDARLLWGGVIDNCSILIAPPVRECEDTHGYYN